MSSAVNPPLVAAATSGVASQFLADVAPPGPTCGWQMQRKKSPPPLAPDLPFRQAKLPFIPMKPSRSRCNMISWAASSGERSAVLMVTSASVGIS